ncbi:MAG: oxidoreductase [Candidatus Bathyarchaeota archaeon]|nr:oxidoreductase [Candidatus Bathyarchaeota archaeon]MDH5790791.1 oxidoreductase [Candidatus Bathyarchaeota archaeon]
MDKLKFGFYWAASCGGCEIAVLDIDEKILDVLEIADVVFWPVAMDVKYKDVEAMPDGFMDVCFFNGAVRTEEQERLAKLLRRKAKALVAFGSCAHMGGIPGLANVADREEVFERSYLQSPSTVNKANLVPQTKFKAEEGTLTLPEFYDTVMALDQVVDVDYYLPGCPPAPGLIVEAVQAIAGGNLPPKGAVLAPEKSVCDECPRVREEKKISEIRRIIDFEPEPEKCLLEQGIVCMGPATRGGCEARCLNANMPCTGCGGPCPGAIEQGTAMISALSTVLGLAEEKQEGFDPEALMAQLKDPVGTFYKYGLPVAIMNRRIKR